MATISFDLNTRDILAVDEQFIHIKAHNLDSDEDDDVCIAVITQEQWTYLQEEFMESKAAHYKISGYYCGYESIFADECELLPGSGHLIDYPNKDIPKYLCIEVRLEMEHG